MFDEKHRPGQRSLMDLVVVEHKRRVAEKRAVRGVSREARELARWVREAQPGYPRYPAAATVEVAISKEHRAAGLTDTR
jgi:hypothetical protein